VVVGAVLFLLLAVGYAAQAGRDSTGERAGVPAGAHDTYAVAVGDRSAPVTVTVFEDFLCPFCGDFEAVAGPLLAARVDAGDVRLNYRVMSFLDHASAGTAYSTRAANALAVVLDRAGPEAAAQFHDALFAHQPTEGGPGLDDAQLIGLAVEAGARRSDVDAAIRDRAFEQWVVNATDAASRLGVTSTPTVLVDGEPLPSTSVQALAESLQRSIDAALRG
jgi:protein-disulfide isomerase